MRSSLSIIIGHCLLVLCYGQSFTELLKRLTAADNVISSGDNMELSIDVGAAQSMPRKDDLYIKVLNTYDGSTVCQSKLVDHISSGMNSCAIIIMPDILITAN